MSAQKLKPVDGAIVDVATGEQVKFEPVLIQGQGWTIGRVTDSRRAGRIVKIESGFETCDYTFHQAQLVAEAVTRYVLHTLARNQE